MFAYPDVPPANTPPCAPANYPFKAPAAPVPNKGQ